MGWGIDSHVRRCQRCLRLLDEEGTFCPACLARFQRLRRLDRVSTIVITLSIMFFGLIIAAWAGVLVLEIDGEAFGYVFCSSIGLLILLVTVCVPILTYMYRRESV